MNEEEEIKNVLKQIAQENENTNKKTKKSEQTNTGCLIALILVVIIIFAMFKGFTSFWNSLGNNKTTSSTSNDYKMEAYIISQDYMKDYLKSPSTAKFPWYSDVNVVQTGDRYKVEAYVDSENDYGTKIRTKYYMILERNIDGGWTKISCDIK